MSVAPAHDPATTLRVLSPANGELVGEVGIDSAEAVRAAVARARLAQPAWGARSVAERASIDALFASCDAGPGAPDVVVYNPSFRVRGPFLDLDPVEVKKTIDITAYGGFLVAQQALRRMVPKGKGVLLLTGASASVKGYAQSAPFAMGKFALRGLAQSLAREFQPKNIHVAHFVIDGGIRAPGKAAPVDQPDSLLEPDAIADSYFHVARQPRSAWSWEIELRPWVERF